MSIPAINAPLVHAEALSPGERIALDRTHARGLRFREINPKEAFTIIDRDGRFFRAALMSLTEEGGEALVYELMPQSTESKARITLFCAVLGRQRMLTVVQKATELGAVRVVPVLTERSVPRAGLAHEKAHAWPAQALRASRQCRRASVPEVRTAVPFEGALADECFRAASRRFYLDVGVAQDRDTPLRDGTTADLALVVGPEGGFTDGEQELLRDRGATALSLGGRTLRAETAVIVGLARLQHSYGDL